MKHIARVVLPVALLLMLPGIAWAENPHQSRGKALAAKLCARCHAIDKSGTSLLEAAPPFRSIAGKYPTSHLEEALAEGIAVGHPAMPEFVFNPSEIEDLLAFVGSLKQ